MLTALLSYTFAAFRNTLSPGIESMLGDPIEVQPFAEFY